LPAQGAAPEPGHAGHQGPSINESCLIQHWRPGRHPQEVPYRTAMATLCLYSFWTPGSMEIQMAGQEAELYDYSTRRGQMELQNVAMADQRLYNRLYNALVSDAIAKELRAALRPAQQAALQSYLRLQAQGRRLPQRRLVLSQPYGCAPSCALTAAGEESPMGTMERTPSHCCPAQEVRTCSR
jgi:hypothetical protein